jgi:hypothetical protein
VASRCGIAVRTPAVHAGARRTLGDDREGLRGGLPKGLAGHTLVRMGFYETPLRRLRLVRAGGLCVLAIAFLVIPFLVELDTFGRIFGYGAATACILAALVNVWWSRRTPPERVIFALPGSAPPSVQLRFYRQMVWVSVVAFPVLSAAVAYELHELQSGAKDRARLWAPLVPVYERLGFWPAVLAPLLLGALCCTVFLVKIRKLARGPAASSPG